jgi:hypothetical protein
VDPVPDLLLFFSGSVVEESRPPLWSSGQSSWLQDGDVLCLL